LTAIVASVALSACQSADPTIRDLAADQPDKPGAISCDVQLSEDVSNCFLAATFQKKFLQEDVLPAVISCGMAFQRAESSDPALVPDGCTIWPDSSRHEKKLDDDRTLITKVDPKTGLKQARWIHEHRGVNMKAGKEVISEAKRVITQKVIYDANGQPQKVEVTDKPSRGQATKTVHQYSDYADQLEFDALAD